MFRFLTRQAGSPTQVDETKARALFLLHPAELSVILEVAWERRVQNATLPLGHPDHRSDLLSLLLPVSTYPSLFPRAAAALGFTRLLRWDHLIYAYMIESTRIYEIFRRVLQEFLLGEQLGSPDAEVQSWLRNTEEAFYRDPPRFFITSLTSQIRPDLIATRRNAYYRLFGMDLIHGKGDGQSYPYEKAKVANTDFVATFEEFLREVWVGIVNALNTSGENPTDNEAIAALATKLHDMLRSRRVGGNLSREEFLFVSMMAWFHLTVEFDSPIVSIVQADAASPEQRLQKIGERVGLAAPARTKSFFDLADPLSFLLTEIETGVFNSAAAVSALYTAGPLQDILRTIITHWSLATGQDLKTRKTTVVAARA
jgi:hypothetical protein